MIIIKQLLNFGESVFEIECNVCKGRFYYDRSRVTTDRVTCLVCANTERWSEIAKNFVPPNDDINKV